jgi:hypothetical protein
VSAAGHRGDIAPDASFFCSTTISWTVGTQEMSEPLEPDNHEAQIQGSAAQEEFEDRHERTPAHLLF